MTGRLRTSAMRIHVGKESALTCWGRLILCVMLLNCTQYLGKKAPLDAAEDLHSYANNADVRVTHVDLDLHVDFDVKQLRGTCTLELAGESGELVLDTRELVIDKVEAAVSEQEFLDVEYELGEHDPVLGAPLRITLGGANRVRVHYATGLGASGLQWLTPRQTAGGEQPFLYTQSQAIHARSWIPLQDTPAVRATYSARIRTPRNLLAVMSAEMLSGTERTGEYKFTMPLAIPSYLIALAVGDIGFSPMSERTGVFAEHAMLASAAREFEDTEDMMQAVEQMYGPYRWGRYDILVLPPSFPFGGMENPRLTFVSPTVITGDKSLVSLIAHELAHSWSGNLVTNATWRDFWLNEGFTVYLEERIQEQVFGSDRSAMEALLEVEGLKREMADMDERDQILHVDLRGRDPDDGFTGVPYAKGAMFLRTLEKAVGRPVFDAYLRSYFEEFAFKSLTTGEFAKHLKENLLNRHPGDVQEISVEEWLQQPRLPTKRHEPESAELQQVVKLSQTWVDGAVDTQDLPVDSWTTQHWLRFLRVLPEDLPMERMEELDKAFRLTHSGNAEILSAWFLLSIRSGYNGIDEALEPFLLKVGRRKFVGPLYKELVKAGRYKDKIQQIYRKARPGYHPVLLQTLDPVLGWDIAGTPEY